jgi:hypothetical protein
MIDEHHPFPDSIYGDTRKRFIDIELPDGIHSYFQITPRRYDVDERYASLLQKGDISLNDIFREIITLGRQPSPQCLWLYTVISYKVKRENFTNLSAFDKNRFDYKKICFDEYDDLMAYLYEHGNTENIRMKMEWETNIPML